MNEAELFGQLVRANSKIPEDEELGQLAEKANTGVKHLGQDRRESGEKQPSFELVVALARALNVSPATFFTVAPTPTLDSKFLTQQLQALLTKRDAKQLRKAYRVLQATLEP